MGGVKTYFFYADEGLVGKYESSGSKIRSYGYRPHSIWTTDPLFLRQENEYYFYHTDHLGAPVKLVRSNGAVVWSAQYTAFGEATVDISTVTNNLRFGGQYYDAETGLHYNFHRYYDPKIGRYLRHDPLELNEGINFYTYSANNPLNFIDPKGLACTSDEDCLICLVYSEAGGTNNRCLQAVAWVIKNRIGDTEYFGGQNNACKVAAAEGQFDAQGTDRWDDCCDDCLEHELEQKAKQETTSAIKTMGTIDITSGSTFFIDISIDTPRWIQKKINKGEMEEVPVSGCKSFRFYRMQNINDSDWWTV